MQTPSQLSAARVAMRQYARLLGVTALAVIAGAALPASAATNEHSLAARVAALEAKEEIRALVHAFAQVVDSSDPAALAGLSPAIHANFSLDAVDFEGHRLHFEGLAGLLR